MTKKITKPEATRLCAEFMGWVLQDAVIWCKPLGGDMCEIVHTLDGYNPLEDLDQAWALLDKFQKDDHLVEVELLKDLTIVTISKIVKEKNYNTYKEVGESINKCTKTAIVTAVLRAHTGRNIEIEE